MTQEAGCARDLDVLPLERLETEITTLAGQISAATCLLVEAIAAYDRREGWATWECRSMTHWLTWRAAMSAPTAREHIRVGHALYELPLIREQFASGQLSYSQVRALTRIAVPVTESQLVELARSMTASQLDRLASRYRGVRAATTETAKERHSRRQMVSYLDDDGMRVIIVRQPPEEAAVVLRAVDAAAERAWQTRKAAVAAAEEGIDPDVDESVLARRADALVSLAETAASADPSFVTAASDTSVDRALLVLHVSPETLANDDPDGACHVDHGPAVAPETARRIGCDAATVTATQQPDGTIEVGRRSRRISPSLRRALNLRDQTCIFPGCDSATRTEAHHVRHWTAGGPTTLENLAVLCGFHHHRLHEGGYSMRAKPGVTTTAAANSWEFVRPDGRAIPDTGDVLQGRHDGLPAACNDIEPDACTPQWDGTRLDLPWIVEGLLFSEGLLEGVPGCASASASVSDASADGDGTDAGTREGGDVEVNGRASSMEEWTGQGPAWPDPWSSRDTERFWHQDDGWHDGDDA
jgi:hypothetical protein